LGSVLVTYFYDSCFFWEKISQKRFGSGFSGFGWQKINHQDTKSTKVHKEKNISWCSLVSFVPLW